MNKKMKERLEKAAIAIFNGNKFSLGRLQGAYPLVAIHYQSEEPKESEIKLLKKLIEKLSQENGSKSKALNGFNTYIFRKKGRFWTFCRRQSPERWFPHKRILSAIVNDSINYSS